MNKKTNYLTKSPLTSALFSSLLLMGCGSDGDSKSLARAVELERLRANGTIIETVTIIGGQMRLIAGETHQLSATGIDSNNDSRDVTNELTWTSSDTSIAKVSSKGLVTAVESSDINQGIVLITGTTINDMYGEADISVSDVKATGIDLKQSEPVSGSLYTCIDASIAGDVTYEDGYVSLNTVKNMSFSVDDTTTANISSEGVLYTSNASIENTTILAMIDEIADQLTVTADPSSLEDINIILADEEVTSIISLNIGQRLQLNAQATLVPEVSTDVFTIDNSVSWQEQSTGFIGVTNQGEMKGTILALETGVTVLHANCGGQNATATIQINGEVTLESAQINDGAETIAIAKNSSIELTLTTNYSEESSLSSLNVSEFTQWTVNGSSLATAELISLGTKQANYKLTAAEDVTGELIVSATYDGITSSVIITID